MTKSTEGITISQVIPRVTRPSRVVEDEVLAGFLRDDVRT